MTIERDVPGGSADAFRVESVLDTCVAAAYGR